MDIVLEATIIGVFSGAASATAVVLTAFLLRRRAPTVQLERVLDPEGKHYHVWDRTAKPPQAPGYYCACGTRAPEARQPLPWRRG